MSPATTIPDAPASNTYSRAFAIAAALPLLLVAGLAAAAFQVQIPMGNGAACAGGACAGGTPPGQPQLGADEVRLNDFALYVNSEAPTDSSIFHWSSTVLPTVSWGPYGAPVVRGGASVDFASVTEIRYQLIAPTVATHNSSASGLYDPNFTYAPADNSITFGYNELNSNYSGAAMATTWSYISYITGYPDYLDNYAELTAAAMAGSTQIRATFHRGDGSTVAQVLIPIQPKPLAGAGHDPANGLLLTSKP